MPGNLELYSIKADSLSSEPKPLVEQLRDAFYEAGLDPPDGPIHTDGRIHRFAASNKPGDDADGMLFMATAFQRALSGIGEREKRIISARQCLEHLQPAKSLL